MRTSQSVETVLRRRIEILQQTISQMKINQELRVKNLVDEIQQLQSKNSLRTELEAIYTLKREARHE